MKLKDFMREPTKIELMNAVMLVARAKIQVEVDDLDELSALAAAHEVVTREHALFAAQAFRDFASAFASIDGGVVLDDDTLSRALEAASARTRG